MSRRLRFETGVRLFQAALLLPLILPPLFPSFHSICVHYVFPLDEYFCPPPPPFFSSFPSMCVCVLERENVWCGVWCGVSGGAIFKIQPLFPSFSPSYPLMMGWLRVCVCGARAVWEGCGRRGACPGGKCFPRAQLNQDPLNQHLHALPPAHPAPARLEQNPVFTPSLPGACVTKKKLSPFWQQTRGLLAPPVF